MKIIAEFKKCPDCEVDAWLMGSIVRAEIEKGNMSKDAVGCTRMEVFCNVDPSRPPIIGGRLPGARVLKDMCTKCGKEHTVRIETGHVTPPTKPGMPATFS